MELSQIQEEIVLKADQGKVFLSGPAGCGKTTAGMETLRALLLSKPRADTILVLTPQRTLHPPYASMLNSPETPPGTVATLATVGGIAQRMVDLFWPLVVEKAGFQRINQPPVFLTLETAQYYMARIVQPLIQEGAFDSLTIDRNRLYAQILDNLNKAAAVGFPYTEIGARLDAAWYGDPAQRRIYADAQESATRFRVYCLEHNLLDFSLQLEVFIHFLWQTPECRDHLSGQYRHLIYDNVEEDVPVAHDLLCEWLPEFETALLIADDDGGYRRFLGADPESAERLRALCDENIKLNESFVMSAEVAQTAADVARLIAPELPFSRAEADGVAGVEAVHFPDPETPMRFFPQMLDWVTETMRSLIEEQGVLPGEIAVLSPYLSDALRFSLHVRMDELGIPWRSHRPSRSLRDEPASRCLLTLAALAHPGWQVTPTKYDIAHALLFSIDGMDLVRAHLLAGIVYRPRELSLSTFDEIRSEVQERITASIGARYSRLRGWLLAVRDEPVQPLDFFLRRLFDVVSRQGFGFHRDTDAAQVAASLVESVEKFHLAMEASGETTPLLELGREYLQMLDDGVIAAQYLEAWQTEDTDTVLMVPAHTFLMMNRPVQVQFWLDTGSPGWWERLAQPLTQPYILSRQWMEREPGSLWLDADEVASNQTTLARLVTGLLRRCRERVYIGLSDLDAAGYEQRGPLLKALWKMQVMHNEGRDHV